MLLQPETRPISHDQLIIEVKGIYAGLVMVEAKYIDIDEKQSAAAQEKDPSKKPMLKNDRYQSLIALHKQKCNQYYFHHRLPPAGLRSTYRTPNPESLGTKQPGSVSIHFFFSSFINSSSRASSSSYDGSEYAGSPSCCDSGYCGGGGQEYLFLFDLSPLLQTWVCCWKMVMRRCMAETFRSLCCGKSQFVLWKDSYCVAEGFFLCQAMIFLVLRKDCSCVTKGFFIVARKDPSWVWDGFFLCRARIPLVSGKESRARPRLMVQRSGLGRT